MPRMRRVQVFKIYSEMKIKFSFPGFFLLAKRSSIDLEQGDCAPEWFPLKPEDVNYTKSVIMPFCRQREILTYLQDRPRYYGDSSCKSFVLLSKIADKTIRSSTLEKVKYPNFKMLYSSPRVRKCLKLLTGERRIRWGNTYFWFFVTASAKHVPIVVSSSVNLRV